MAIDPRCEKIIATYENSKEVNVLYWCELFFDMKVAIPGNIRKKFLTSFYYNPLKKERDEWKNKYEKRRIDTFLYKNPQLYIIAMNYIEGFIENIKNLYSSGDDVNEYDNDYKFARSILLSRKFLLAVRDSLTEDQQIAIIVNLHPCSLFSETSPTTFLINFDKLSDLCKTLFLDKVIKMPMELPKLYDLSSRWQDDDAKTFKWLVQIMKDLTICIIPIFNSGLMTASQLGHFVYLWEDFQTMVSDEDLIAQLDLFRAADLYGVKTAFLMRLIRLGVVVPPAALKAEELGNHPDFAFSMHAALDDLKQPITKQSIAAICRIPPATSITDITPYMVEYGKIFVKYHYDRLTGFLQPNLKES